MRVRPISSAEVAQKICELFYDEFGGKTKGRFQLSKDQLKLISGVERLSASRVDDVCNDLINNHDLLMICWVDDYFVIESNKVSSWRKVPSKVINKYKVKPAKKRGDNIIGKMSNSEKIEKSDLLLDSSESEDFSEMSIFSQNFEIEMIEWEYDDNGIDSYGFCDFKNDRENKVNNGLKCVSALFELEGDCLNWDVPEKSFQRSVNGKKSIKIILMLENNNWYVRTDLYMESDEKKRDVKWSIKLLDINKDRLEIYFYDDSELDETGESSRLTFFLRPKKNT